MVNKIRKLRESFLPLLTLLIALVGIALLMDEHAERRLDDYTVLPVRASSETWQSDRMDDDGMDGTDSPFVPDVEAVSRETSAARALSDAGAFDRAVEVLKKALGGDPENVVLLNEMGVTLIRLSRTDDAIGAFTRAVASEPTYFRAYYNRAVAYQRDGDLTHAAADYEQAIRLHPNHFESQYNLGLLKMRQGDYAAADQLLNRSVELGSGDLRAQALFASARARAKLGKKSEAIRRYKKSIEYKPDYILPRFNLAVLLAAEGNAASVGAAEMYLSEITALRPDFAPAYFMRGRIASKKRDKPGAIAWYERAVQEDSSFRKARYNLGLMYLRAGKIAPAKHVFLKMAKDFPNRPEVLFNLGKVSAVDESYDEAAGYYTDAIAARKGDYPEATLNLGTVYKSQGKIEKAIETFDGILEKKPGWGPALLNKGTALLALKRYDAAVEAISAASAAGVDEQKVQFNLGVALADQKKYAEAATAYRKASAGAHPNIKALVNLGFVLGKLGNYVAAEVVYRRALEIVPSYTAARLNLASALRKQEKWKAAAEECRTVTAQDESNGSAWNGLGIALAKMGDTEGAAAAFEQVLEIDPSNVKARYNLALQQKKQGELGAAEAELRRTIRLSPHHFQSHVSLADILGGTGRDEEALQLIAEALRLRPGDKDALELRRQLLQKRG